MATAETRHSNAPPSPWLTRWAALLPEGAAVLDLACGSGRHVRWLAQRGFPITAVDRDVAALAALRDVAGVEVVVADIENMPWPLSQRRFDAVLVFNYLWRPLWPRLRSSLAPGGLLIYETFAVDNASVGKPSNPDFLLRRGELLDLSAGMRIIAFEDGFLTGPDRFVQRIAAVDTEAGTSMSAQPPRYPL